MTGTVKGNGLDIGGSLAVVSANKWMKTFQEKLSTEVEVSLGESTKMSHLS